MTLSIEDIVELYRTRGAARYGMEAIDQERHALQCALLAERAGASWELITAALLHDLGHLLADDLPRTAAGKDQRHEHRAIPLLRDLFPEAVLEPIRMHVEAKRFLCMIEPAYEPSLSPASRHSLMLQGGSFTNQQAASFIVQPYATDAVDLRRWDDYAKSPTRETPGWPHFVQIMRRASLKEAQPA